MVKYWPTERSIYLNNIIVDLFIETEKKIRLKKYNKSNQYLYLDTLNIKSRNELFNCIVNDLKKLILDIIELDLDLKKIDKLNHKIRKIFIKKVYQNFLSKINYKKIKNLKLNKIENNHNDLMKYLLIYFTLGSSSINQKIFIFQPSHTPYNHVKILLENFIIQTGNEVIRKIFHKLDNSPQINTFLKKQNICNKIYLSNRATILLLNNLKWQYFLHKYVYQVKYIYSERQQILILSSQGIITKYIKVSRVQEINNFNKFKTIFTIWLEIKDLIIPKLEKLVVQIAKYFLYSSLNLINNILIIVIKTLIFYLKN